MGKEMINEVVFLIKMLEEEWSVSKETRENVVIDRIEAERFVRSAAWVADEVRKYMDEKGEEMEFEEYVRMMKQSCILLRLGKKIFKNNYNKVLDSKIELGLDKEEYRFFYEYFIKVFSDNIY